MRYLFDGSSEDFSSSRDSSSGFVIESAEKMKRKKMRNLRNMLLDNNEGFGFWVLGFLCFSPLTR